MENVEVKEMPSLDIQLFTSKKVVSNLTITTISLPANSVKQIVDVIELEKDVQKKIIFDMVDANPKAFNALDEKEAQAQIYVRLTQETVIQYLLSEGTIDGFQQSYSYFLEDGTLVIEAFQFDEDSLDEFKEYIQKAKNKKKETRKLKNKINKLKGK